MKKLILVTMTVVSLMCLTTGMAIHARGQFLANGNLPPVPIPNDNPQTDAKIRLGKQLYFDTRLSSDGTISCASCHQPDAGWADLTPVSEGVAHKKGGQRVDVFEYLPEGSVVPPFNHRPKEHLASLRIDYARM